MREDSQRAGGIESEPSDGVGVDVVLVEDAVDGGADAAPDVVGGLFLCHSSALTCCVNLSGTHVVALLRLPQADVLRGQADNVALGINNASAGTAGADVDTNVVIHVGIQLIVRICTHLT